MWLKHLALCLASSGCRSSPVSTLSIGLCESNLDSLIPFQFPHLHPSLPPECLSTFSSFLFPSTGIYCAAYTPLEALWSSDEACSTAPKPPELPSLGNGKFPGAWAQGAWWQKSAKGDCGQPLIQAVVGSQNGLASGWLPSPKHTPPKALKPSNTPPIHLTIPAPLLTSYSHHSGGNPCIIFQASCSTWPVITFCELTFQLISMKYLPCTRFSTRHKEMNQSLHTHWENSLVMDYH